MDIHLNDRTGRLAGVPFAADDPAPVLALLSRCPVAGETPLVQAFGLAARTGVGALWVKDERSRMGLGSFKALGAAYVIAHLAQQGSVAGRVFVTASAGNHGMSVAAGAQAFGARAVIYLADTVPEGFADRLRDMGAEVVRDGAIYEDSMAAALRAAESNGWTLLSDSSWPGYTELPHRLMEGYLALAHEASQQVPEAPSHILLQAGVGGMAAALAAHARRVWGDGPVIVVVEPDRAPALIESARVARVVDTTGPESSMGRLDCKTPSMIALASLLRDADAFVTISEQDAAEAMPVLAAAGLATSPSGGAGLAALLAMPPGMRGTLRLDARSRVLCILSEGA